MKIFEMPYFKVFIPNVKRGGGGGAQQFRFLGSCWQAMGLGRVEVSERAWEGSPVWSGVMVVGGFDSSVANRGGL